jgi:serine/threonine-protein kinase RsbW
MAKKYSESTSAAHPNEQIGKKRPKIFVIASDRKFLDAVLAECAEVPSDYSHLRSIEHLRDELSGLEKLNLAFALIVERNGDDVDAALLRACKLEYPQIFFVMLFERCEQRTLLRLQSLGVNHILLPPFSGINLSNEMATMLPNVPQFKRHPELLKRGQMRLDFLLPSDLSYVVGMSYFISLLLKEFGYPVVDSRINIPLACDEAITNAVIHGNKSEPDKKVGIQIYLSHSRFKVRIRDQGEGFDVSIVQNPTEGENLLRSSGRGIYLMKNVMDSVEFKEEGTVVEMEKKNANANSD